MLVVGLRLSVGMLLTLPWKMSNYPNIWTGGSREDFSSIGGFEVAGAGVYLPDSELAFDGFIWGTAEEYGDARLERCRAFMSVPGVMQTVQRAEFLECYCCHAGLLALSCGY